ncbi:T9SS type A sorting domain-containing protein [Flavobacterium sp. CYK-4]|uniref:T9SS type A sorting domain-containing protein n=1 Tax=Flavobacterium lotistagni TaxID=2709660 RepID=UPI001407B3CD|nr:T9SS type A sorting domain-containing protein [Flavobacterium lotistagni]NHM05813.1 T9SS type A sorting domain-containing protein [Flavobacterium lotistagni]
MKKILYLFITIISYYNLSAQNRVFDDSEMVNFDRLDLKTVVSDYGWRTSLGLDFGTYSNYRNASFIFEGEVIKLESEPSKWVKGYVKHYAKFPFNKHVFPIGDPFGRNFLETDKEIDGESVTVAWLSNELLELNGMQPFEDLTPPEEGIHDINSLYGLSSIRSPGFWDWRSTNTEGSIIVKVNTLENSDNPDLRLAGWKNNRWECLCDASPQNGIISCEVGPGYTALAIGKKGSFVPNLTFEDTNTNSIVNAKNNSDNTLFYVKVYPNPIKSCCLTLNYLIDYTGIANVYLYDLLGKVVLTQPLLVEPGHNSNTVDTSQLASGVYHLSFKDANHSDLFAGKKIIIQN